ncbi:MAG: iron-containing alcohol dehydrogenase [Thermoplasmata archaeon]|nr:iron-containing alcohol dehydrogenase [Thermoplasmata archaeon]
MPKLYTPGRILFGYGTFEHTIEDCDLIIVSPSVKTKITQKIENDVEFIEFKRSSKTGEPLEQDVYNLKDAIERVKPGCVAAIGGGSVIDATKLALVLLSQRNIDLKTLYQKGVSFVEKKTRLIGVETTSGTGTGISAAAVVIDNDGVKHGLVGEALICDRAVYDPSLVMSMSKETTAYSGMDALTHAIESYTSTIDNLPADTMALKAVEIAGENIIKAVEGDKKSREMMHYANLMAAIGFANSRLGICHALSHKIGGRFNIPHGKINAMLLPHIISFNASATSRYKDIAMVLGLKTTKDVVNWVKEVNEKLGIPPLSTLGEKFYEMIPQIARETENDGLMKTNPRKAKAEEIEGFLKETFEKDA